MHGCYTLLIAGERIPIKAGDEYLIPRGVRHGEEPAPFHGARDIAIYRQSTQKAGVLNRRS